MRTFPLPNTSLDVTLSIAKIRAKKCLDNQIVVAEDSEGCPIYQTCSKQEAKEELGHLFDTVMSIINQINCSAKATESISRKLVKELNISEADYLNIYAQNIEKYLRESKTNSRYINEGETLASKANFKVIK